MATGILGGTCQRRNEPARRANDVNSKAAGNRKISRRQLSFLTTFGRVVKAVFAASSLVVGQRLDQIDDALAHLGVLDLDKGLVERQAFGAGQKVDDVTGGLAFGKPLGRLFGRAGRVFEKEGNGHFQHSRDVLQTAGADAIRSLFVFLDLLKRNTKMLAELFLTHSEHHPTQTDTTSDVYVNRIG